MIVEVDNKGPAVGYLDLECLRSTTLSSTSNTATFCVTYILNAFEQYATKNFDPYRLSQYKPLDCSGDSSEAAEGLLS
jgi:hypothetical protein